MNRREFVVAAAAAPFLLRSGDALARLAGGTPYALVTADTEAHVAVVYLTAPKVVRRIPTLAGPRSIESDRRGRFAVVAHTAGGAVSILDGWKLEVRHVLHGFSEPRYTAISPDGRHAFVSDSKRAEVVTVDVAKGQIAARLRVLGPARHLSLSPNGKTLWVSLGTKAAEIVVVDVSQPAAARVLRRFSPPFLAHDVGFEPDGRRVWVTSGDRGALARYTRSGRLLQRMSADAPPQHVTFSGDRAYVTSGDDSSLHVHALDDGRVLRTTAVPVGSYNVQDGWGLVFTPSLERGTLCMLDERGRLLHRLRVAASSHDACFVMAP
jgi:DNA-binding beta-propeller fold protein YncE